MSRVDHPRPRRRAPAAAAGPRCSRPRRVRGHAGGALRPDGIYSSCCFNLIFLE